jgi:CRISPR type III-associated protein (TIGR04423 family)
MTIPQHKTNYFSKTELKDYWITLSSTEFVGYVWMSNIPLQPQQLWTSPKPLISWEAIHNDNNFIWEANLYQKDKRSIFIQQINDTWKVCEVFWEGAPSSASGDFLNPDPKYLMSDQSKKLLFREAWLPQEDPLCCQMEILQPAWLAFIGFEIGETK